VDGNLRNREFLGQGLAFPLQLNARGGLALAAGPRDIEQSIRIILETLPGERVMRPEFGCRVRELIFAPRNAATEGLLIQYVFQALGQWEPRIEVQEVRTLTDSGPDGAWVVEILYQIKDTHDQRSLVYPFFIGDEAA
jgi:phage baseplate assembly protein W